MKISKNLLTSAVTATVFAAASVAPVAQAEVSGSVGVASTYLWRGQDLGSGTPAVSGDLSYSTGGFYAGVWGSSGDTLNGTEYDVYAGYGMAFGENDMFTIDLSVWNYNYPTGASEIDFGDLSEVVLSVGIGPVALTVYDNIAGGAGYMYYTLSGSVGQFSATLGMHDAQGGDYCSTPDSISEECQTTHLDVSYAYNDNLSFTLSQEIADESPTDDLKFVVSYSLPIGE